MFSDNNGFILQGIHRTDRSQCRQEPNPHSWCPLQVNHHIINVMTTFCIMSSFSKNLRALAKMPGDYAYRKHTESLINERVAILKQSNTIEEAEKKIGMGQIEEVIIQAENELTLSRSILEWKPWEPLAEQAPANQWKWPI